MMIPLTLNTSGEFLGQVLRQKVSLFAMAVHDTRHEIRGVVVRSDIVSVCCYRCVLESAISIIIWRNPQWFQEKGILVDFAGTVGVAASARNSCYGMREDGWYRFIWWYRKSFWRRRWLNDYLASYSARRWWLDPLSLECQKGRRFALPKEQDLQQADCQAIGCRSWWDHHDDVMPYLLHPQWTGKMQSRASESSSFLEQSHH